MKKPELIAPAGDLEKLKTALTFGADAVYFGVPEFSLRVRINDFNLETIREGIALAHSMGKKAYVTVNIFAHQEQMEKVGIYLKKLKTLKPDALFVSDPGILLAIKKYWPKARLSLSTQANCTNALAAKFWYEQGFSRIIPSRELSLEEIKTMVKANPKLEIETFVHGALCMAYSGRCFLSQMLAQRNANLGDCSQPCRWEYNIQPIGHSESLVLGENEGSSYILNSLDLCLIKRLPELIKAGISSFKIEGRAKSVYYLANVVGAYRQAIDLCFSEKNSIVLKRKLSHLYQELNTKLTHRGYTEGFMFNNQGQNLNNAHNTCDWEFCGQVLNDSIVKVHNTILVGDTVEIVEPGYIVKKMKIKQMIDIKTNESISSAHGGGGGQQVKLNTNLILGSVIRRKL